MPTGLIQVNANLVRMCLAHRLRGLKFDTVAVPLRAGTSQLDQVGRFSSGEMP